MTPRQLSKILRATAARIDSYVGQAEQFTPLQALMSAVMAHEPGLMAEMPRAVEQLARTLERLTTLGAPDLFRVGDLLANMRNPIPPSKRD